MKRQLKVGDTIKAMDITATIAEITFQEPWEWRNAWYLEFTDTNGIYRNWKQNCDGGKAYDENGNEIVDEEEAQKTVNNEMSNKEDKKMAGTTMNNNGKVEVIEIVVDGVRYVQTRPNYYYKNVNGKQTRISKVEWEMAWEKSGMAEKLAKEAEEAKQKPAKAKKSRKSKDIALEVDGVTITKKQADFIQLMPEDDFYEHGLDSALWIDVFCDTIADKFNPMAVGAMVSTLREKGIISVSVEKVNGKKSKYFAFTEFGKKIAQELGLE